LLGLPPLPLEAMLSGSRGIPIAPGDVVVGIPADLLRRRPDVRRAELAAVSQSAQIGFAKADLLPAFSLSGTLGGSATTLAGGSLGDLFTSKGLTYAAGPAVQWNILNYGRIINNVRAQDARLQTLLTEYASTVIKAQKEVEDGLAQFLQYRAQVALLRKSVAAATEAFQIALKQYEGGIADFTTVLLAEQNLYQAQSNLAQAIGNVSTGLIAVYRALGGGLQIREGHDFVPAWTREVMAERTNWGWGGSSSSLLRPVAPTLPTSDDVYGGGAVPPPQW
jgi:outer membrane protein TolC